MKLFKEFKVPLLPIDEGEGEWGLMTSEQTLEWSAMEAE